MRSFLRASRWIASMRPGQQSPGIGSGAARVPRDKAYASMRPGQQSPGIVPAVSKLPSWPASFNEAGATKPRNCIQRPPSPLRRTNASMRPGQQSPGIVRLGWSWAHHGFQPTGFNEAGATKPRNSSGCPSRPRARRSFNEAGATKPRNSRCSLPRSISSCGFNEAGATKPRNLRPSRWSFPLGR